jgi:hypothetical protein
VALNDDERGEVKWDRRLQNQWIRGFALGNLSPMGSHRVVVSTVGWLGRWCVTAAFHRR